VFISNLLYKVSGSVSNSLNNNPKNLFFVFSATKFNFNNLKFTFILYENSLFNSSFLVYVFFIFPLSFLLFFSISSNLSLNIFSCKIFFNDISPTFSWNNKLSSHQTIKQDGITGATVNRFGICSTAAATAAKTVSITTGTFNLEAGARVSVKFSNANTANSPTLNVNSKGAKNIFHKGAQITSGSNKALLAGVVDFIYDGTQWHLIGNYIDSDSNTHRPIQVNGTEILGNNTTALNLKAGSNVSVTNSSGTVTIAATQPKVSVASSTPSSASSGDIWFKIVS
jgi:hypothetical protein